MQATHLNFEDVDIEIHFIYNRTKEVLTDIAHMLVNISKEAMGSLLGETDGAASIQEGCSEIKRKHFNFVNVDSLN